MSDKMQVILSASSKGGVGKSEIAKLLAYRLKKDGNSVAMMDADIDSSNLSSRMGIDDRVSHTEDEKIEPVEKDGIMVYSMESAFTDSSFSQSGEFMRVVIRSMVQDTNWHDPDYLIVDTPPGTKDIFNELVKVLRNDLLGAVVIGQSNTLDDVGRMIKVCNHGYVPILGLIENMSGIYAEGELIKGSSSGRTIAPFGRGGVKKLADNIDAKFFGSIPLCNDTSDLEDASANCIKSASNAIQRSENVDLPDMNEGNKSFIMNVLKALRAAIGTVNSEFDIDALQSRFGNPDNPRIIELELTDAKGKLAVPSKIHLKIEGGLKIVRSPNHVDVGISMSSQELKYALQGQRKVLNACKALYSDDYIEMTSYGLVEAVQMGNADVWGDDVIHHLSLIDKVFDEVVSDEKLDKISKKMRS